MGEFFLFERYVWVIWYCGDNKGFFVILKYYVILNLDFYVIRCDFEIKYISFLVIK